MIMKYNEDSSKHAKNEPVVDIDKIEDQILNTIQTFRFVPEGNYDDRGFLHDESGQLEFDEEAVYVLLSDVTEILKKYKKTDNTNVEAIKSALKL